jgi:hypothetical protein
MTDFEIMELLDRQCSNWEKGAILRKAFDAQKPSVMNIKPQVERKKRAPNKPKPNGHLDLTPHEVDYVATREATP